MNAYRYIKRNYQKQLLKKRLKAELIDNVLIATYLLTFGFIASWLVSH